jgi:hypothetical protein
MSRARTVVIPTVSQPAPADNAGPVQYALRALSKWQAAHGVDGMVTLSCGKRSWH